METTVNQTGAITKATQKKATVKMTVEFIPSRIISKSMKERLPKHCRL